jgi:hypothetical protein
MNNPTVADGTKIYFPVLSAHLIGLAVSLAMVSRQRDGFASTTPTTAVDTAMDAPAAPLALMRRS